MGMVGPIPEHLAPRVMLCAKDDEWVSCCIIVDHGGKRYIVTTDDEVFTWSKFELYLGGHWTDVDVTIVGRISKKGFTVLAPTGSLFGEIPHASYNSTDCIRLGRGVFTLGIAAPELAFGRVATHGIASFTPDISHFFIDAILPSFGGQLVATQRVASSDWAICGMVVTSRTQDDDIEEAPEYPPQVSEKGKWTFVSLTESEELPSRQLPRSVDSPFAAVVRIEEILSAIEDNPIGLPIAT